MCDACGHAEQSPWERRRVLVWRLGDEEEAEVAVHGAPRRRGKELRQSRQPPGYQVNILQQQPRPLALRSGHGSFRHRRLPLSQRYYCQCSPTLPHNPVLSGKPSLRTTAQGERRTCNCTYLGSGMLDGFRRTCARRLPV